VNDLDIYNNDVYDCSGSVIQQGGISIGYASNNEIYDNRVEKVDDGNADWLCNCYKMYVGSDNKWYRNIAIDGQVGFHIDNNSGAAPACDDYTADGNQVYYNLAYNNRSQGIFIEQRQSNAVVYNNTTYGGVSGINIGGDCSQANSNVLVKNNIMSNHSGAALIVIHNGTGLTLDYNLYYDATPTTVTWYWDVDEWLTGTAAELYCVSSGGDCDGTKLWANFKTNKSQEANAPTPADPLFNNASNGYFLPKYNSPAIDNGTDVSLTQDYTGAQRNNRYFEESTWWNRNLFIGG
jgi:hypothetical protein